MRMRLDTLQPGLGSKRSRKRVGRGKGSGVGKTCGKGHKGQKARNTVPAGFEGGQMPLHRRVPKFGFSSWKINVTGELRLSTLDKLDFDVIDMPALREHKIIAKKIKFVKIIASGDITRAITVKGIRVTKGAKAAIEKAGGKVEE